jgi:hypothetical protein
LFSQAQILKGLCGAFPASAHSKGVSSSSEKALECSWIDFEVEKEWRSQLTTGGISSRAKIV